MIPLILLALFVLGLLCTLIVIFVWITRGLYRALVELIRNERNLS